MDNKWKTWYKVFGDPKWYTNNAVYTSELEAFAFAERKLFAWTQCEEYYVCEEGKDPNEAGVTLEDARRKQGIMR